MKKSSLLIELKNLNKTIEEKEREIKWSHKLRSEKMSNILIFSPTPSHPQDAGNRIRIYNFAKYLQKMGNAIHFIYYTQEGLSNVQLKQMQNEWDSLTIIKKEGQYKKSQNKHFLIDDWYQEDIGLIILQKCQEYNIDIILVNYIFQSKLLEFVPNHIVKIIDTHDRFSDRHIMLQKRGIEPDFFYTVKREEAKAFDRADIILAIQDKEATFFKTFTDKQVKVIGHIEERNFIEKKYTSLKKVGFIGSGNSVNLKSLLQFIEKFIDFEEKTESGIKLYIAGSICSKIDIQHKSIITMGFIKGLKDFYSSVDLVVNPLILGTGLKIKTIEALSYATPVVSTQVGFEGVKTNSNYHTCQNIDELLIKIKYLHNNPNDLNMLSDISKQAYETYMGNVHLEINNLFILVQKKIEASINVKKLVELNEELLQKDEHLLQRTEEIELKNKELKRRANRLVELNEELLQKDEHLLQRTEEIELKNKELKRRANRLVELSEELNQKSERIRRFHNKITLLEQSISNICNVSTVTNPVQKLKAYKSMIKSYHDLKDN